MYQLNHSLYQQPNIEACFENRYVNVLSVGLSAQNRCGKVHFYALGQALFTVTSNRSSSKDDISGCICRAGPCDNMTEQCH
jgi:hypothetical protein